MQHTQIENSDTQQTMTKRSKQHNRKVQNNGISGLTKTSMFSVQIERNKISIWYKFYVIYFKIFCIFIFEISGNFNSINFQNLSVCNHCKLFKYIYLNFPFISSNSVTKEFNWNQRHSVQQPLCSSPTSHQSTTNSLQEHQQIRTNATELKDSDFSFNCISAGDNINLWVCHHFW